MSFNALNSLRVHTSGSDCGYKSVQNVGWKPINLHWRHKTLPLSLGNGLFWKFMVSTEVTWGRARRAYWSVFVSISDREWIALHCPHFSPPSALHVETPSPATLHHSPFNRLSPINRWTTNWSRPSGSGSGHDELLWKSWTSVDFGFSCSWEATPGNALLCKTGPKYSVAVSLWSGHCCGSSHIAMSCVSLWPTTQLSPAKVIAPLRQI